MRGIEGRRQRLAVVLIVVALVSLWVLWHVIWTVFFALTFVYVLYPLRQRLVAKAVPPRVAAASLTGLALAGVLALFAPLLFVLYERRTVVVDFLRDLPAEFVVEFGDVSYTYAVADAVPFVRETLSAWALEVASSAPVLGMKAFLFVFIVYAILYRPGGVRSVLFGMTDGDVQAELTAYHERVRDTLYGLYFVQAATGTLTFLIALPVFYFLGYDAFFSLSVVSGILQFVPIVGPSVVVVSLALVEIASGNLELAIVLTAVGLVFIGFLPDAILRPRLARYSAGMPATVYFIGFLGGVLTLGPIGIIAGPLVLSLLIETVELVAGTTDPDGTPAASTAAATHAESNPSTDAEPNPSAAAEPNQKGDAERNSSADGPGGDGDGLPASGPDELTPTGTASREPSEASEDDGATDEQNGSTDAPGEN